LLYNEKRQNLKKVGGRIMRINIQTPSFPPDTPQVILAYQARVDAQAGFIPALLRRVAKKY